MNGEEDGKDIFAALEREVSGNDNVSFFATQAELIRLTTLISGTRNL